MALILLLLAHVEFSLYERRRWRVVQMGSSKRKSVLLYRNCNWYTCHIVKKMYYITSREGSSVRIYAISFCSRKFQSKLRRKAFPRRKQVTEDKFRATFSKNFILTYTKMMWFVLQDTIPMFKATSHLHSFSCRNAGDGRYAILKRG